MKSVTYSKGIEEGRRILAEYAGGEGMENGSGDDTDSGECMVCLGDKEAGDIVVCDGCNRDCHFACCTPPLLQALPDDEPFFCLSCRATKGEDVAALVREEQAKQAASKSSGCAAFGWRPAPPAPPAVPAGAAAAAAPTAATTAGRGGSLGGASSSASKRAAPDFEVVKTTKRRVSKDKAHVASTAADSGGAAGLAAAAAAGHSGALGLYGGNLFYPMLPHGPAASGGQAALDQQVLQHQQMMHLLALQQQQQQLQQQQQHHHHNHLESFAGRGSVKSRGGAAAAAAATSPAGSVNIGVWRATACPPPAFQMPAAAEMAIAMDYAADLPECYVCGEGVVGGDTPSGFGGGGGGVYCSDAACKRLYHRYCTAHILAPMAGRAAAGGDAWLCPLHRCVVCGAAEKGRSGISQESEASPEDKTDYSAAAQAAGAAPEGETASEAKPAAAAAEATMMAGVAAGAPGGAAAAPAEAAAAPAEAAAAPAEAAAAPSPPAPPPLVAAAASTAAELAASLKPGTVPAKPSLPQPAELWKCAQCPVAYCPAHLPPTLSTAGRKARQVGSQICLHCRAPSPRVKIAEVLERTWSVIANNHLSLPFLRPFLPGVDDSMTSALAASVGAAAAVTRKPTPTP
ncbi:unnamed protein product, partial [Phaeothamnion confervicola]